MAPFSPSPAGPALCVGEVLVDLFFAPPGRPAAAATGMLLGQGGSPANVAVGLARLGHHARVTGPVGQDELGDWLRSRLLAEGVDVGGLLRVPRRTGVVFVTVDAGGQRRFLPAREGTADHALGVLGRAPVLPRAASLLHFSSGPLRTSRGRAVVADLRRRAEEAGVPTSFDVNLRPGVWPSLEENVRKVRSAARGVDVLKANAWEALQLTGARGPEQALERLRSWARRLAVITLGEDGAMALGDGGRVRVKAPRGRIVDTTGAGDAFMAGLLAGLIERGMSDAALRSALLVGCRLGTRVCAKVGATAGLPRAGVGRRQVPGPARGAAPRMSRTGRRL